MPKPKRRLQPYDPFWKISQSPLFDELGHPELVVYLRVLGRACLKGSRKIAMTNAQLYRNTRSVPIALAALEGRGLVVVNVRKGERTITVRR